MPTIDPDWRAPYPIIVRAAGADRPAGYAEPAASGWRRGGGRPRYYPILPSPVGRGIFVAIGVLLGCNLP